MTREAARGEIRCALLGFANALSRDRRDTSPSVVRLMATTQLRRALLCCLLFQRSHALSATSPWSAFTAFNADAAWRGYAYAVDPATAVPKLPGIEYSHFVALDDSKKAAVRTTTTIGKDASADSKVIESVAFKSMDVDLDGSYSCEHPDGLGLAALLRDNDDAPKARVIEHCLATSDDERRRCLLSYSAENGMLESVLLLVERKSAEVDPAAHATLFALAGNWRGDACVRAPLPPSPPARGFGKKAPTKEDAAKGALGPVRTAVFKARLTYAWDGVTDPVGRQLSVTSFGEATEDKPIRSSGNRYVAEGDYGEYETVRFAGEGMPTLLLLPSACHLLAPMQISENAAFTTEFGAVLEPGESFGWRGYQPGDDEAEEGEEVDDEGLLPAIQPEGDADAPRLVRISRLYSGAGKFASGTTSLLSAE